MLSVHQLYAGNKDSSSFIEVDWMCMARDVIENAIRPFPSAEYNINPYTLKENGAITSDAAPRDPSFTCNLLATAVERNLYALYATMLYVSTGMRLGLHYSDPSKLAAFCLSHEHIMVMCKQDRPLLCNALHLIYGEVLDIRKRRAKEKVE